MVIGADCGQVAEVIRGAHRLLDLLEHWADEEVKRSLSKLSPTFPSFFLLNLLPHFIAFTLCCDSRQVSTLGCGNSYKDGDRRCPGCQRYTFISAS